jgi:lipoprotein-releasing system permease protein
MLLNDSRPGVVIVRGVDPQIESGTRLEEIVGADNLQRLTAGSGLMLLGQFVAGELGVQPGDPPLEIVLPDLAGGRFNIRRAGATVIDTFYAGDERYDNGLALMHLDDASRLIGLDGRPQGLAIRLREPMDVGRVVPALRAAAGPGYAWSDWASENSSLFRAMKIEKAMMTILLMLIVAVAAFNIVTSLTMVVNEKEKDIAILRTLGIETAGVMRIFLFQGGLFGLDGTLAGLGLGRLRAQNLESILTWAERTFGFRVTPGEVYYVARVQSTVEWHDLILIAVFSMGIALFATIWPSRQAARIQPADVLRYE